MQGRQLARGSALSSCFAKKKKSRVRGPKNPAQGRGFQGGLEHLRQFRAAHTALIIHAASGSSRPVGENLC